ncbi:helix-turn-helix domain-containing protein [Pseudonocardia sp. HH130630-07]|uniref:AraC-like ligand-binding domain-containing protein n=1 Tax=Pseudonocardia sp. HH130630-07 TaxID=1690815 RepID=UPI00081518DB|nr:helix-turn-helix domain-containing protein [Pseudonocardia sp. HH130630-07]ANY06158.1 AraC family transcriptional regulator [Pseudonocardia sp. HH130630-07]
MITDIGAFQEELAVSGLPPVIGGRHDSGAFRAGVTALELGPLRLVELVTPEGECFRDARCLRAEDEKLWQIDLMTRGRARVEQGGAVAELGPADLVLIDPERPVRYAGTASSHVTMLVPRTQLRLRPGDAARLAGVRIAGDSGPGALVSALARDVVRSLAGLDPAGADRSGAAVVELVSVALAAQLGDARTTSDDALRDRIVGHIEVRLADRRLTPATIAAAHHISVRRLHSLFEDQPLTVAALVRRRRLERCHADLARGDRTVAAVAARWGFADPAHFSRLFSATYGYSAAALTARNRARIVKAPSGRSAEDGGLRSTEG